MRDSNTKPVRRAPTKTRVSSEERAPTARTASPPTPVDRVRTARARKQEGGKSRHGHRDQRFPFPEIVLLHPDPACATSVSVPPMEENWQPRHGRPAQAELELRRRFGEMPQSPTALTHFSKFIEVRIAAEAPASLVVSVVARVSLRGTGGRFVKKDGTMSKRVRAVSQQRLPSQCDHTVNNPSGGHSEPHARSGLPDP